MPNLSFSEKQTKDLNCGAFGLTAICNAFGLLPTKNIVELRHCDRIAVLAPSLTLTEVAEEIYRVTGDLMPTGGYSQEGEYLNSASAISYVAKQLGLRVTLNASEKIIIDLEKVFPGELMYCAEVANQMFINNDVYDLPSPDECQLVVVATFDNSYHWLAVGSNGVIYDPATGKAHCNWAELTATYERLSVWLSFSLTQENA
ncbi:hypothetical protein KI809_10310 [Geobacter pelophilus]|uniref:Peptidase_C39 like family protein n=1 Tax=Geoanaerobacter pelophilus TaxID=60036 RepID=A0AAW4LBY3_9BACT|nr:hypothetical protein [Geoanaerobacter pelophilus]MBT0664691.1 hypothetical protein [Geoanaerobacter pelophilus]